MERGRKIDLLLEETMRRERDKKEADKRRQQKDEEEERLRRYILNLIFTSFNLSTMKSNIQELVKTKLRISKISFPYPFEYSFNLSGYTSLRISSSDSKFRTTLCSIRKGKT